MSDGVIVGSDVVQEWILPWWWDHYAKYNQYPVTFIDFGLSEEKRKWCAERGELLSIRIPDIYVKEAHEIDPAKVQEWEGRFCKRVWEGRKTWFKKPAACLKSPYERTCWIDLDCEIRGSIAPLFEFLNHPSGIALFKEETPSPYPIFNGGVIAFRKNLPLLIDWEKRALHETHLYAADQDLLSSMIHEKKLKIQELPEIYNWNRCRGDNDIALIYHWVGVYGKNYIQNELQRKDWESFLH